MLSKKLKINRISIVITSRADYGPLDNLIKKFSLFKKFHVDVIFIDVNLKNNYGDKFQHIKKYKKINYIFKDLKKTNIGITNHILKLTTLLIKVIKEINSDLIVILGDRYELLSIPPVSLELSIPVLHIGGGHVTEGAFDDSIRHMLTKFCHLHVTSSKQDYKNILSLCEERWRVAMTGSLSAFNPKQLNYVSSSKLLKELDLDSSKPYCLITLHSTTNENDNLELEMNILIKCLRKFSFQFIITYPNYDPKREVIIKFFKKFVKQINIKNKRAAIVYNLGRPKYLSLMKNCVMVIGNSSSGIIESPSFGVAVVNIGNRQKGRIMSKNIFNCKFDENEITESIEKSILFSKSKKLVIQNPYFKKNSSDLILKFISKILKKKSKNEILYKKIIFNS